MIAGRRHDDSGAIEITPAQRFDRLERLAVINMIATGALVAIHAPELEPVIRGLQAASTLGNAAIAVSAAGVVIMLRGLIG